MSDVSHYGTPLGSSPEHTDWQTDVTSSLQKSSIQSEQAHLFLTPGKEGGLVRYLTHVSENLLHHQWGYVSPLWY